MKCKLSKLFFLVLMGSVAVKGYSQTEAERKKITEGYDLVKLNKLAKDFEESFKVNYSKGLEIAKERNLPISGTRPNGAYFSLKGYDEETGDILYYVTSNNGPANSSVQTARAQHLYQGGRLGINIQGQGMNVGIWDGGQPQASHQNLGVARVTNKDSQYTTNSGQGGVDHATHVAGTMIGNGSVQINARGLAFNAYLWSNTWENDNSEMALQSGQGLLVSNHSYGVGNEIYIDNDGFFGRYVSSSRAIDALLFTADKYLPVIAAGNDRSGVQTSSGTFMLNIPKGGNDLLTHEATSKNAVVVAAVNGITDYTSNGYNSNNVVMSNFSQWGPTDDFRIKPDISAKGVAVYSSNMPSPTSANSYASYPGTSMAAPAVSAVFILWQQYFNQLWPTKNYMRSASLKALMAHTASEAGTAEGPDGRFGWGLINAEGGAEIMKNAKTTTTAVFQELTLLNGETYELNVVTDGSGPLEATIAWTDKEASVVSGTDSSASLLINDLDLRIVRPNAEVILPWAMNKSWSNLYAIKADNNVDTIEKVIYYGAVSGKAAQGTYKIRVSHKGSLDAGQQKYTLIVSGGVVDYSEGDVSVDKVVFENLNIYPNPASDILNISSEFDVLKDAQVTIYDMLGKRVYQNSSLFANSGEATIDVSVLNNGVYLVEILKDNKIETKKIVIK